MQKMNPSRRMRFNFSKKSPSGAFSAIDEQSATDSGLFLRELSEVSPQSVANPLLCDGVFVCSNVLEDHNASSSRKSHAFAILANMFVNDDVLSAFFLMRSNDILHGSVLVPTL